jgi:hypothetical protein
MARSIPARKSSPVPTRRQKRRIDALNEDAAIPRRLNAVRDLDQLARGEIRIGKGTTGGEPNDQSPTSGILVCLYGSFGRFPLALPAPSAPSLRFCSRSFTRSLRSDFFLRPECLMLISKRSFFAWYSDLTDGFFDICSLFRYARAPHLPQLPAHYGAPSSRWLQMSANEIPSPFGILSS